MTLVLISYDLEVMEGFGGISPKPWTSLSNALDIGIKTLTEAADMEGDTLHSKRDSSVQPRNKTRVICLLQDLGEKNSQDLM